MTRLVLGSFVALALSLAGLWLEHEQNEADLANIRAMYASAEPDPETVRYYQCGSLKASLEECLALARQWHGD